MSQVKNGLFTTEFFTVLVAVVTNLIVMTGWVSLDSAGQIAEIVVQIIVMIMSSLIVMAYNKNRTELKKAEMDKKSPRVV